MRVGDFEMFALLEQGKGTCPEKCRDPRSGKRRTLPNNKNTGILFGSSLQNIALCGGRG